MSPSEIRTELLTQHAGLRGMIEKARRAAGRVQGSEAMRGELRVCVGRLASDLREHNRREEELLRGILPTVDAWGPVRQEIMDEQHVAEHVALCAAFVDANAVSDAAIAQGTLLGFLDLVLEHMAREEGAFLGEDVLRDDAIVVDQFSG